jgi:TolA-binding protein
MFNLTRLSLALMLGAAPSAEQVAKTTRDAGVSKPSTDAGVAVDGGVAAGSSGSSANSVEVEQLRKQVGELRVRVVELEGRVVKVEALTAQVDSLKGKLDTLRGEFDEAERRRQSLERDAQARKAATSAANTTVNGVLQQLSTGNVSNVDAWLKGAEQQYTGNAQRLVQLARAALAQSDLNGARQYLNLALIEAATPAP